MIFERCPACKEHTSNTSTSMGRTEDGLCDGCLADLQAQDDEYEVWLANLPLHRKAQRAVAKGVTQVKIAIHQWQHS